ncbi:28269_t:CDS:1 [Dentiscutata erythropus]|uniref:28269_t:CDS:1 n=1 Tax=Dentiscutata erythropus TaxID=1348616 RepID=A0A9N9G0N4_9GLOM|nr:28269_t:CDS:1 [Dentiscutata erythropus]
MADEHVFVDSMVVKKAAPMNKDPNDIMMKFPPSIEAKDLILKPTDGKKPRRSPNAFIIYRKLFVQTARANGYNLQMTEISKTATKSWKNEAEYVKKYYKRLAKEAYKYRSEMFPKTDRRKKRQQWNIVSFKSTSDEQESHNDTDSTSSTSNHHYFRHRCY